MEIALELKPVSLIGFGDGAEAAAFTAMNPATGSPLEPKFFAASAEDLERAAALAQAAFIIGSSVLLAYEALGRFHNPHEIHGELVAYGVMAFAIVLTFFLVSFQRYVINRTNSMAIGADHLHYVGDIAVNIAVVIAFALHQWVNLDWADPVFALVIAGALAVSAWRIAGMSDS